VIKVIGCCRGLRTRRRRRRGGAEWEGGRENKFGAF